MDMCSVGTQTVLSSDYFIQSHAGDGVCSWIEEGAIEVLALYCKQYGPYYRLCCNWPASNSLGSRVKATPWGGSLWE